MTKDELKARLLEATDEFSYNVQTYLPTCNFDSEIKNALDEIARQSFYALRETQEALLEFLDQN